MTDHCPACRVRRELTEHRDACANEWSQRRAALNFAVILAQRACPEVPAHAPHGGAMSDLTRFRDHCRDMATAEHKPECVEQLRRWEERARVVRWFDVPDPGSRPECPGCNTAADRALFAQLAGEVDAYLAPQVDLFGEETAEPTPPTAPETP